MEYLFSCLADSDADERAAQAQQLSEARALRPLPDELARYLLDPVADKQTDILAWWRQNSQTYPKLAVAARDVLAGQASSAASERVFSHGGDLITCKRANLAPETIRAHMLLHSWLDFERTGWQ
jgi:nicotinamide mononucleotide adenylyltransferase